MNNNKIFAYARVSTKEQNLDRQLKAFKDIGIDERDIIIDKESGKNIDGRAGYIALRNNMLRSGDTLIVKSLDRLSRNKNDIKNELEYFKSNNIRLKVIDLPTTMIELPKQQDWIFEMINNILIEVLGTIAEQERTTIRARADEGIKSAKENGVVFGRPKAVKPDNWNGVITKWNNKEITAVEAMKILNLTKPTFYRLLKN
jgi:DNA invertase Pin-like site-specific DNA recombinase